MTCRGFTARAFGTVDADIETRVASRTTIRIVGMAGLAQCQVALCQRPMIVFVEETAVEFVRNGARGVAGDAVI
ncbi:MAG: hypothetical protein C0623_12675 [Desulfuromonas sp.]|nr:MAG: hypothetical protein C0623_12675 [Desulfuromonas sp.]